MASWQIYDSISLSPLLALSTTLTLGSIPGTPYEGYHAYLDGLPRDCCQRLVLCASVRDLHLALVSQLRPDIAGLPFCMVPVPPGVEGGLHFRANILANLFTLVKGLHAF